MLPGDGCDLVDAAHFGDDGSCGFEVIVFHDRYICDNRDYRSSEICDLRDRKSCDTREYAPMSDHQSELRTWFREKTAPHGIKSRLAEATGFSTTQISRMRNVETDDPKKRQEIPLKMIELAAQFFNELPPGFEGMSQWLDDPDRPAAHEVPLVGYVGAGATAHFYAAGDGNLGKAPAPDGATASTVAVEVRGDSLGALFEHWLVYYDEVRSPVTSDMIGRLCVVGLPDDRVLVKKIQRSKAEGLYHLLSNTEEPIFDQEVLWAARVKSMMPRG